MSEEQKYYTPEIEHNFWQGYECERYSEVLKGWEPYKVSTYSDPESLHVWVAGKKLRVPYLTKEQVEAEGWNFKDGGVFFGRKGDRKGDYEIEMPLQDEGSVLKIRRVLRTDDDVIIFYGSCPSINELRYISKLLGI